MDLLNVQSNPKTVLSSIIFDGRVPVQVVWDLFQIFPAPCDKAFASTETHNIKLEKISLKQMLIGKYSLTPS